MTPIVKPAVRVLGPAASLLLTVALGGVFLVPRPVSAQTAFGEIEGRPAPVSHRRCVGGTNAGALCNENADCPGVGAFCQDRNVFNITVNVRFPATAAQLQNIRDAFTAGNNVLFDATDGQAQFGQVTILNNPSGTRGTFWVTNPVGSSCSTDTGSWGEYSGGNIQVTYAALTATSASGCVAHEFSHLVFDVRDEYESRAPGCGALTGAARCPLVASGEEDCLMECCLGTVGTEFCWGQGNPLDVTDISGGNHDPSDVTEQSRCRSNRSCWDQIGWSWPNTFLVPAGAPDPGSNGLVINPTVFLEPPATARVVLVLDRSGSMASESPTRLERLRVAALDFVDLAENGMELGLVSFSDAGTIEVPIAALGADRSAYTDAINALAAGGATNIGDGLQNAIDMIFDAGGVTADTSIVLMTDGLNNRPFPDPAADLQSKIDTLLADDIPVFVTCTGDDVGLDSQCAEIASGTGGTYVDSNQSSDLAQAFTQFHEAIRGRQAARSRAGAVDPASKVPESYTVDVENGAKVATFVLLWPGAGESLEMLVIDPAGGQHRGLGIHQGRALRVTGPMPGTWTVFILPGQTPVGTPAALIQPYLSRAYLGNPPVYVAGSAMHPVVKPGQPIVVHAFPHFLGPLAGVEISGDVTRPDGAVAPIQLFDDGGASGSGDEAADDGTYTATYTPPANMTGAFTFRLDATAGANARLVECEPGEECTGLTVVPFVRQTLFSATVNDLPQVASLCLGSAAAEPGQQVTVPITLSDGAGVAGFQVDLSFNPAILTPVGVALGADTTAAGGWSVNSAAIGLGALRVLGHSNPPAGLTAGFKEMALVTFEIAPGAPIGTTPLTLNNCVLGDARGQQIPCSTCPNGGQIRVRNATSFRFRSIPQPVGVDRFDPLPFPVTVEALDSAANLATAYGGTASMFVTGPICGGTLQPTSLNFTSGLGGPDTFTIGCCLDPLLPMTTATLGLLANDPVNGISGNSGPFPGVAKGDVDANNSVNVLDITRAVRLALNQTVLPPPPQAFQRWAGNMLDQSCLVDAFLNVLDVIRIRNKALLRPPLCPCLTTGVFGRAAGPAPEAAPASPITLSLVKDGPRSHLLKVKGAVDLGGVQLDLRGVSPKTSLALEGLTAGRNWQTATSFEGGVLKVLAFGNTATGISGDGVVLRIHGGGNLEIATVVVSDSEGRAIPAHVAE